MDPLNKLRLLAGLPIDPKTMVTEARHVPQHKHELQATSHENHGRRVDAVKRAVQHLESAVQALESIPAMDFGGEIPHFITQIEEIITHDSGEGGLKSLVGHYTNQHEKFKKSESERVAREQEEEAVSSMAKDAVDHHSAHEERMKDMPTFERGQKAMLDGEEVVVVAAKEGSDSVGVVPVGQEHDIDAIQIVHVSELEPAEGGEDESPDVQVDSDADADVEADSAEADLNAAEHDLDDAEADEDMDDEDLEGEDHDEDDDSHLEIDALSLDQPEEEDCEMEMRPMRESSNFYYEIEGNTDPQNVANGKKNGNTLWKEITPANNKDENPTQLTNLGKSSGNEQEQKVRVPAHIKTLLKDAMKEVEDGFSKLGSTQMDDHFFYNSLLNALGQLLQLLEGGTLYDMKQAQIYMGTLMGPILFKIPAEVRIFIQMGGEKKSLKDYLKPVDPAKFPITGPRQTLS